ncbi:MAG: hypothetical protein ABW185_25390 [Sedimenticola sp.]
MMLFLRRMQMLIYTLMVTGCMQPVAVYNFYGFHDNEIDNSRKRLGTIKKTLPGYFAGKDRNFIINYFNDIGGNCTANTSNSIECFYAAEYYVTVNGNSGETMQCCTAFTQINFGLSDDKINSTNVAPTTECHVVAERVCTNNQEIYR